MFHRSPKPGFAHIEWIFATSLSPKMPSAFDVAAYVLQQKGPMTTWKLQKLVYYCQAWSLVREDEELFPEEIQAWANGPVVPRLYAEHRGEYRISYDFFKMIGDSNNLNQEQKETVDKVLSFYGDKDSQWLSNLTHMEDPWKDARVGLSDNERGTIPITKESLKKYYSSI